ncbi:MAG: malate dehydrogenase (quinone) [Micrococcales bacterium]
MSATLGTFLKVLNPAVSIRVFERLDDVSQESSNPWNNAGTGHAALCELNYMPDSKDGSLPDPSKAISINEQFQLSREFWSWAVQNNVLGDPDGFIHATPHMTFVRGAKDVDYLSRRYQALKDQPLFKGMEFSADPEVIRGWAPLLIDGRTGVEPVAATRIESGTDVDFGAVTRQLLSNLQKQGVQVSTSAEVKRLTKRADGTWDVVVSGADSVNAKFVFVGAGGWALKLLQSSGIAEAKGYGTFPVGGQWLRTDNPEIVAKHRAKVYSQASVGAPPMSVPHLDTRVVDGKTSLLFGPYATSNPKFLKNGSILDLPLSVRPANVIPYLAVALSNFGLIKYLVGELLKSKSKKFESLLEFMPEAKPEDWRLLNAGQRAQIIKKDAAKGGVLQFGTEIITSADGSISGLLGASPGASTAVYAMLEVLKKSFGSEWAAWEPKLREIMPSFGIKLNADAKAAAASLKATAKVLKIK